MKPPVTTRIEEEMLARLEAIAAKDKRSLSQVIEICIEFGLPKIEREILGNAAPKQSRKQ